MFMLLYAGLKSHLNGRNFVAGVRRVAPFAAVQILFWAALRVWLLRRFAANLKAGEPTHGFVLQLGANLHAVLNPMQWPLLITSVAPLVLPLLLGWRWMQNKAFLIATGGILLLWFLGMFLVGVILEVRVFNELISFVAPCIACMAYARFGENPRSAGTAKFPVKN